MTRQNNLENLIFLPSLLSWCRGGQGREQENDLEEQAGGRNKGINVTTKRSRQLAECVCVCVCVFNCCAICFLDCETLADSPRSSPLLVLTPFWGQ